MGPSSYAYFDKFKHQKWEELIRMVKLCFIPVDIDTQLLTELFEVKMSNNDFHTYYTTFNAYRRHLALHDDKYLPKREDLLKGVGITVNSGLARVRSHVKLSS